MPLPLLILPGRVATVQPPAQLLSVQPNNQTLNGSFTLPPATQSIAIVTDVQAGDTAHLSLTGAASGHPYYSQELGTGAYELIGVPSGTDSSINWIAQSERGPGVSFRLTALATPPPAFIMRSPPLYEVPQLDATLNQVIPFGGSFTWISPPAGQALRLFHVWIHWRTSTKGFGEIKGSGTSGVLRQYDQIATNFVFYDFKGRQLAINESLVITNDDVGNGQAMNGGGGYSLD